MNPEPLPAQPVTAEDPRPVHTLGNVFVALTAVGTLLMGPQFLSGWADYGRLSAHLDGTLSREAFWGDSSFLWRSETLTSTWLGYLVLAAAMVVLLVWVWRARRNAALLTPAHRFRFSPGFSAGGLLIPFVNLWLARPIFEEI
jgi:transposase InsO family protein